MPTIPPFAAEYAAWPIIPSNAAIDAVMITTPRSLSSSGSSFDICAAARRITLNVPTRNDSTVIENPSCDAGVPSRPTIRPPPPARPPQFTATRNGPWLDATRTTSSTSSSFSTSQRTNSVLRAELGDHPPATFLVDVGDDDVGPCCV